MGDSGFHVITHPGYGKYNFEATDEGFKRTRKQFVRTRDEYICNECGKKVLAFQKPKNCQYHD